MSCQGQGFHNWQTTLFVAELAKYPCYLLVSAPLSLSLILHLNRINETFGVSVAIINGDQGSGGKVRWKVLR